MIRPEELIFSSFFIVDDWPIHLTWCTFWLTFFNKKKKLSGLRLSKMAAIIEIEGADSVIPIKISSAGH